MYRIFIVEDDEIISEVLKKNLSSWGYDVSCAEDFSNIIQEFVRRDPAGQAGDLCVQIPV